MEKATNSFFEESSEQSRVKAVIVAKYFAAWARVIMAAQNVYSVNLEKKIAYIDLFAGPGRYADGTKSTPLLVLEKAIRHDIMRDRLITVFNDKDEANINSLQEAINQLPGIGRLRHKPQVKTQEVGEEIVKMFEQMKLIPTLFFVDPWGYRGLSLRLVNSVLKDWGCDCIFFFNYNRINMGLNNAAVKEHMDALFGEERAAALREKLEPLSAFKRQMLIVEELCQAIKAMGPRYVLPFCFKDSKGTRTSHHLIFVSKGFKGYEIMKEIMAKECSGSEQGVPSFEYNPVDARDAGQQQLLFQLSRPLDNLADMLLLDFAGQTLTMKSIFERHNVDRPYIKKNYKEALMKLEEAKKIAATKHRQGTFGDTVKVTFPPRKGGDSVHGR
jgi:three-Cys-motif partner protein